MDIIKLLSDKEYFLRKKAQLARRFPWVGATQWGSNAILYQEMVDLYYGVYRRRPELDNPQDLNEKLLWLSFYWRNPLKAVCADKYACRDYVTQHCGLPEELLVPLIGVWDKAEEIDFNALPNQFVLKCNHGCGYNIIVKEKSLLDIAHARKQLNQWLSEDYAGNVSEIHYKDIKPHKIICEQYIPSIGDQPSVVDYKLMCFNGEPQFVLVCYDRNGKGGVKLATFSLDWEQLFFTNNELPVDFYKPESIDDQIKYTKVLSKEFPFVRVDFYDNAGRPLFGEMTFTPAGNLPTYFTPYVITKYGELLQLPQKYMD